MPRKRKRVAIFSPQLTRVGTAAAMLGIAHGIAEQGEYDVDLLALGIEWQEQSSQQNSSVRVIRLFPYSVASRLPAEGVVFRLSILFLAACALPLLTFHIMRHRPEYLVTGLLPWISVLVVLFSRTRTSLIVSVQGFPRHSRMRQKVWSEMARWVDAWVVPTRSIARSLHEWVQPISESRIHVIPNPVIDLQEYKDGFNLPDHTWYTNRETAIVLGAGRLTRQKNFSHLIRSFAELLGHNQARLIIIGEGDERKPLTRLLHSLNIADRVSMPGHVSNPRSYMAHADVFVLSSHWEGPGHVLIEALATGIPCVTVDCPSGPAEILGEGEFGEVVPQNDTAALTRAIASTLELPVKAAEKSVRAKPHLRRYTKEDAGMSYSRLLSAIGEKSEGF